MSGELEATRRWLETVPVDELEKWSRVYQETGRAPGHPPEDEVEKEMRLARREAFVAESVGRRVARLALSEIERRAGAMAAAGGLTFVTACDCGCGDTNSPVIRQEKRPLPNSPDGELTTTLTVHCPACGKPWRRIK